MYTFSVARNIERSKAERVSAAVISALQGKILSTRVSCVADANARFGLANRPGDELCSVWVNTSRPASRKLIDAADAAVEKAGIL